MSTSTTFTVNFTDPAHGSITMAPGTHNGPRPGEALTGNEKTDLRLYGLGTVGWGEGVDENFIHLLENFASPESDANPGNPRGESEAGPGFGINHPIAGQLWYNTSQQQMYVYNGVSWDKLAQGEIIPGDGDGCCGFGGPSTGGANCGFGGPSDPWVTPVELALNDLTDVNTAGVLNGYHLSYSNGTWVPEQANSFTPESPPDNTTMLYLTDAAGNFGAQAADHPDVIASDSGSFNKIEFNGVSSVYNHLNLNVSPSNPVDTVTIPDSADYYRIQISSWGGIGDFYPGTYAETQISIAYWVHDLANTNNYTSGPNWGWGLVGLQPPSMVYPWLSAQAASMSSINWADPGAWLMQPLNVKSPWIPRTQSNTLVSAVISLFENKIQGSSYGSLRFRSMGTWMVIETK